jgi:RNA polymerase sigma-70 factor (ECF subfamily)
MMEMTSEHAFAALLVRIRAGDPDAAAELLRVYEPHLRRAVRIEMRDERLRRILDSSDVCQSVLASFFVRMRLGQYELDRPEQLLALLAAMARNKVASRARKADVVRREEWNTDSWSKYKHLLISKAPGPGCEAAWRELLEAVRAALTDDERRLSDLRIEGRTWVEIAAELGGQPDSLRIKLARGLGRVSERLGLEALEE